MSAVSTKEQPKEGRGALPHGMPTEEDLRHEMARREFLEFLDFVKVQEPPKPGVAQDSSVLPFEKWPHLLTLVATLAVSLLVVVLKARQVGISWLLASYALWTAMYHEGAVVLLLSKGQLEANIFLEKCKIIYRLLPPALQEPVVSDTKAEFSFQARRPGSSVSKITALPSTEHAGRSETATLVVQDEADTHEFLAQNYAAVKPTIDAGGQLVMASTPNKLKMLSLFKQIYKDAPQNGWVSLFIGWAERPGRTQEWYDNLKLNAPTTSHISADLYMEQEYPGTADEALAPAQSISAFDHTALRAMAADVRAPIENTLTVPPLANIYQGPVVGKRYAGFTDPSYGVGGDFAVTVILDLRTGVVVADIMSQHIGPDEMAWQSVELLKLYRNPLWAIEDNDLGHLVIGRAQDLGYKHLFKDKDRGDKVGWHTDERARWILWGELMLAVKDRQLTVYNEAGLAQFYSVIRNPNKGDRFEAMGGSHDDYPFAVGGAWQMRKHVYSGGGGGTGTPRPRMW